MGFHMSTVGCTQAGSVRALAASRVPICCAAAELDWKEINPDIFGSMIQAVADDEGARRARHALYECAQHPEGAEPAVPRRPARAARGGGDNLRKLRNLRKRLATIRVFDPACGSGNFLVIAYRRCARSSMRSSGAQATSRGAVIRLANFYGIEIKGFAADICVPPS